MKVSIIGAGLAGCEAALLLAKNGVKVTLYEMKPQEFSPAHKYAGFGELVCSNSLKAERIGSAAGMLKAEMRLLGSAVVEAAYCNKVAAGGALAVDREGFSDTLTQMVSTHPNIEVVPQRLDKIPQEGYVIIASGPLTTEALSEDIKVLCGETQLSFFDAAAPIVAADSLDHDRIFYGARYGRGEDDYINCPMNKEQYEVFYNQLVTAESVELQSFDKEGLTVYEGCMPVEVMAKRGQDTLRFGPLKPVGLTDPKTGRRPWAVVQLRQENVQATLYNLVGFQTNLKFAEQKRVFSLIPGLENAEFHRYGVMHRNTFLNSPKLLDNTYCLKKDRRIYFAGQITGVEGYGESAASGLMAGLNLLLTLQGKAPFVLPSTTMIGALTAIISSSTAKDFQPMGSNMGIIDPLPNVVRDKALRYEALALRGLETLKDTLQSVEVLL